jgi:ABC-2 type transport system ATP-binding protein
VPAVEVSGLVMRYGDRSAVDGLTFAAEPGEVLAVLGPNGAGKTTTVETLEGYRRPTAGSVRVLALDPVADRAAVVGRIGVMLQQGGVYPGMTPRRALQLFAGYYDDPVAPDELVDRLGLGEAATTPWRRLSGGEQRRLAMALALVGRPQVAFLDEPTAGVDPQGRLAIRTEVRRLRDEGVCVVLTTHELDEAERVADRVLIIDHGRAVAEGSPADLMRSGAGADIRFGAPPGLETDQLAAAVGAPVVEVQPGEYRVDGEASPDRVAALTAWLAEHDLPLADLRAGRQRLEDVFLRLTSEAEGES